jgi:site-specific recombinase XerD
VYTRVAAAGAPRPCAADGGEEVPSEWLTERRRVAADGEPALFVGRRGRRLARRSIDDVVRAVGRAAGLELSAHVLRHTCLTLLVRQGTDLVLAELAAHRRLETTRRYSLPSEADRQAAVDRLPVDF